MYIMVRVTDNMIIGSANNPINKKTAMDRGYLVYELSSSEYSEDLIGQILESFEEKQ
jgi:hypothetical protein